MKPIDISLKYADGIIVGNTDSYSNSFEEQTATLSAEMIQLGFIPTQELYESLRSLPLRGLDSVRAQLLPALRSIKGADVQYLPMYPNFPEQVMEAPACELFINALLHYWTAGEWTPDYDKLPRELSNENVKLKVIDVITGDEFQNIFTRLLSSNDSISETDKETVNWFLDNFKTKELEFPETIPFKENMAYVASYLIRNGKDASPLVKTSTDVLRVATAMSGGDVSLATNTKFKSQKRSVRKALTLLLEDVINEEDIDRHRNKWVKLFHNLHVGDYSNKVFDIAAKVRNNETIRTFAGAVQAKLNQKDAYGAAELLTHRPGEFARRLDHLIRLAPNRAEDIVSLFLPVSKQVSTRVLTQVMGALKHRNIPKSHRVVFPKGSMAKAKILRNHLPALDTRAMRKLYKGIRETLDVRFSELDKLGKVWIDPELINCPLPSGQRSASEGAFQVARGTQLPIGDKNTLRFFIYWVGRDIDLSATLHDENFKMIEQVSYTHLRSHEYESCHSGDITNAPNGASEFIDITVDGALKSGARYVAMNVFVYAGPTFAEHDTVYAGWMTREEVQSDEVYDPKHVEQKVDLTSNAKNCIPVVFDLQERKAVWTDLTTPSYINWGGNNVESNHASISETIEAIVSLDNKMSLYELFELHGKARGTIVDDKADADVIYSINEGVTPYQIDVINSEYME